MNAAEIFAHAPPEVSESILAFFLEHDRPSHRTLMNLLATRRKLRPVFLEQKPKVERNRWMASALAKKANEDLAVEILQTWLLNGKRELILQFLQDLDIEHDGEGVIEKTPGEPAPALVDRAVEHLLENFSAPEVAIYLTMFVQMDPTGWPHLREILATRPELQLQTSAPQDT